MQSFSELELTESIQSMLERVGFTTPTPIQAAAVPKILAGKDVIGVAGTGTGKTLAFALPILKRAELSNDPSLILCPTRELAIQIRDVFYKLLGPKPALKVTLLIGGAPMGPQTRSLKMKPQVIIATPGRMMDHLHNANVTFNTLGLFVLDEADRMLDMGFQPQIEDILKSMPHERQTAMFTATLPAGALRIAGRFLKNPEKVSVGEVSKPTQLVKQATMPASHHTKDAMMLDILNAREGSILVFARTKHRTDKLHAYLQDYGYAVVKIHGGRTQAQRNAAIQGFRSGAFRILIATDVAARGIDVPNIASVINYDLPECAEDYIHRIGRAGRAGVEGEALSLLTPDDRSQWRIISRSVEGSPSGGHFGEANGEAREARGGFRNRDRFSHSSSDDSSRGESRGGSRYGTNREESPRFGDHAGMSERAFAGQRDAFGDRPSSNRVERPTHPRLDRATYVPRRPFAEGREGRFGGERSERPARFERPERQNRFENSDRPARFERNERSERPARNERFERSDRPERAPKFERFETSGRSPDASSFDPSPTYERSDRGSARSEDRSDTRSSDRGDRSQRSERPFRSDRSERWSASGAGQGFRPERQKHSLKSPRKDWATSGPQQKPPRESAMRDRPFTKRRAPAVTVSAGVKRRARPSANA